MVSCSLHPSGYLVAVATNDQIKIFHVLHRELREFHSIDSKEIKNIKKVNFTNGGQFICITDSKAIHLYDTFTLTPIGNLQISPATSSSVSFNQSDSMMVFTTHEGMLQNYDLCNLQKIGENSISRSFEYKSAIYTAYNEQEDVRVVAVGYEKNVGGCIKIFQRDDMLNCLTFREDTKDGNLVLTDVTRVVTSDSLLKNIVVATNRGDIRVLGMPPKFLREDRRFEYQSIHSHLGEINSLKGSEDGKHVFTVGEDGNLFIYRVVEVHPQEKKKKASTFAEDSMGMSKVDSV